MTNASVPRHSRRPAIAGLALAAAIALAPAAAFAQASNSGTMPMGDTMGQMPMAHGDSTPGGSAADKALDAANQRMMGAMDVKPTGNPDRDFVRMMIAHHQGAIDMAKVELKYGKDPEIRRLASAIVAAQEKEIAEMKAWLAKHP
ncbi:CopM family metallochaperone [Segnochrobactrum spirostomi]|uniref:DUF305 domain-containing protein n=1 Tax=Segnochrobactrum spirostomi TaxID=2608987 RepID=A0A6A7Y5Y5_9HYPH|nr:DUF305 domain-containing protein [Segnochrobactrum spirostomi]MQT13518.1 DUF305 domain-containing protein [Segnochrobactrum spirostomi]